MTAPEDDGACPRCDLEYGHDEPCNRPAFEALPAFVYRDPTKPDPYQALLTQLHEVKTREAALRAGIVRLHTEDGAGDCLRCGYESGWPCETVALLDGEVRP